MSRHAASVRSILRTLAALYRDAEEFLQAIQMAAGGDDQPFVALWQRSRHGPDAG